MRNLIYLGIVVALIVLGVKYWSPSASSIEGVTAQDISVSISDRVESSYGMIVTSVVTQPLENSNDTVVQYVLIVTIDPMLFQNPPTTQEEADAQKKAFDNFTNSMADLLSLSQEYLTKTNPTVAAIRLTVIFLDGQAYDGSVSAEDLNSIPQGSQAQEWLSVMPLAPVVMIPQNIWDAIAAAPDVQKIIDRTFQRD